MIQRLQACRGSTEVDHPSISCTTRADPVCLDYVRVGHVSKLRSKRVGPNAVDFEPANTCARAKGQLPTTRSQTVVTVARMRDDAIHCHSNLSLSEIRPPSLSRSMVSKTNGSSSSASPQTRKFPVQSRLSCTLKYVTFGESPSCDTPTSMSPMREKCLEGLFGWYAPYVKGLDNGAYPFEQPPAVLRWDCGNALQRFGKSSRGLSCGFLNSSQ